MLNWGGIYRSSSPNGSKDVPEKQFDVDLYISICSTLSACVSNPQNGTHALLVP